MPTWRRGANRNVGDTPTPDGSPRLKTAPDHSIWSRVTSIIGNNNVQGSAELCLGPHNDVRVRYFPRKVDIEARWKTLAGSSRIRVVKTNDPAVLHTGLFPRPTAQSYCRLAWVTT